MSGTRRRSRVAVEGSASVVNTVGHYVEKGGATFDRVHGQGALHVARQAKHVGAERLVHISGVGADPGSPSPYVRARGIGETLVRNAFNDVTILRPSVIFGPGDSFLNTLARMTRQSPIMPLFGTGSTRLQPVFVGNVAEACIRALVDSSTRGRVYELGGPRIYAYKELVRLVRERVAGRALVVPCPFLVWDVLAAAMATHPNPPLTRDQVTLMKRDNVVDRQACNPGRPGHSPGLGGGGHAHLHRHGTFLTPGWPPPSSSDRRSDRFNNLEVAAHHPIGAPRAAVLVVDRVVGDRGQRARPGRHVRPGTVNNVGVWAKITEPGPPFGASIPRSPTSLATTASSAARSG